MLELLTSRVWMIVVGVALTAAMVAAFNGIDSGTMERAEMERISSLSELIEDMGRGAGSGKVTVDASSLLLDGSQSMTICRGSIWLNDERGSRAVEAPADVVLLDEGAVVEELIVHRGDRLVITAVGGQDGKAVVQVEKVAATSLTASTNRLHSSSVLYR